MSVIIEKEFQKWLSKVYGKKGMTRNQMEAMRQSWYCSALVMADMLSALAENPDDIACAKFEVIKKELIDQITKWHEGKKG